MRITSGSALYVEKARKIAETSAVLVALPDLRMFGNVTADV
jgi:hypothetical protein